MEVLSRMDDKSSSLAIDLLGGHPHFERLSAKEAERLVRRDSEDVEKLERGIRLATEKGILDPLDGDKRYRKVSVLGKSADEVAREVMDFTEFSDSNDGELVVVDGLSGTGKGTTVSKLVQIMPNGISWSNGDVFRSLTYLFAMTCDDSGCDFNEAVLNDGLLQDLVSRISIDMKAGEYDILVKSGSQHEKVSEIRNTKLKAAAVAERIPTVAERSQGEVIRFASDSIGELRSRGKNVVCEGRKTTLNHLDTKNRFELHMDDIGLLGKRRAAQRVLAELSEGVADPESEMKSIAAKILDSES